MTDLATQLRAGAKSPHEHLTELDKHSGEVSYWLETPTPGNPGLLNRLNVYAHGPEWVLLEQEGVDTMPAWYRWVAIGNFRIIAE